MSAEKTQAERNKEVIVRMVQSLNHHVIEGQSEFRVPDYVWRGPAGIGTKNGLRAFQEEHQRAFLHAFPDKHTIDDVCFAGEDYVASTGHVYATHKGDWLGIPATGKKVKIRYMDIWRLENEKVVESWVLIDIIDFMQQIGLDPLPRAGAQQAP